jgi:hypothetical protein
MSAWLSWLKLQWGLVIFLILRYTLTRWLEILPSLFFISSSTYCIPHLLQYYMLFIFSFSGLACSFSFRSVDACTVISCFSSSLFLSYLRFMFVPLFFPISSSFLFDSFFITYFSSRSVLVLIDQYRRNIYNMKGCMFIYTCVCTVNMVKRICVW